MSKKPILLDNVYEKEMVEIFAEIAEECKIKDFIDSDFCLIILKKNIYKYDLLSLADRFGNDVQCRIITPFEPHKNELAYIRIFQFVALVNEYRLYLQQNADQNVFTSNITWPFADESSPSHKSEYETRAEHYQKQLKSLYCKILDIAIE